MSAEVLLGKDARATQATHLGQTVDELVRKRLSAGLLHKLLLLLRSGIFPLGADQAVLDILVDGGVEKEGLLLHEADLGPPPLEIDLFEVSPPNGD